MSISEGEGSSTRTEISTLLTIAASLYVFNVRKRKLLVLFKRTLRRDEALRRKRSAVLLVFFVPLLLKENSNYYADMCKQEKLDHPKGFN